MANVIKQETTLKDAELYLGGVRVVGVREFNYKTSQEHENIHGMSPTPVGIGSGQINFEGEIKLLKTAYEDLLRRVPNGSYITQLVFDVVKSNLDPATNQLVTVRATACRIKEAAVDEKVDDKYVTVSLPLVIADVSTTFN